MQVRKSDKQTPGFNSCVLGAQTGQQQSIGPPVSIIHRKTVVIGFGSLAPAQPESMTHRNPVVIESGSESASLPVSIIHRKTVVVSVPAGSDPAGRRRSSTARRSAAGSTTWCVGRARATPRRPTRGSRPSTSPTARSGSLSTRRPLPAALKPSGLTRGPVRRRSRVGRQ